MFCEPDQEEMISQDGLRKLLMTCYKLSMDHYPEGPQLCYMVIELQQFRILVI